MAYEVVINKGLSTILISVLPYKFQSNLHTIGLTFPISGLPFINPCQAMVLFFFKLRNRTFVLIFQQLKDQKIFRKVYIDGSSITWYDQLEIDVDNIYAEIQNGHLPNYFTLTKFNCHLFYDTPQAPLKRGKYATVKNARPLKEGYIAK